MHFLSRICPGVTSPLHRFLTWRLSCTHLFVGGLSYDTNESVLKGAFEKYGEIVEVKVICDRVSGKSRGYGFVHYSSEVAASKALKEMDGQLLDGRNIRIHYGHTEGKQLIQMKAEVVANLYEYFHQKYLDENCAPKSSFLLIESCTPKSGFR